MVINNTAQHYAAFEWLKASRPKGENKQRGAGVGSGVDWPPPVYMRLSDQIAWRMIVRGCICCAMALWAGPDAPGSSNQRVGNNLAAVQRIRPHPRSASMFGAGFGRCRKLIVSSKLRSKVFFTPHSAIMALVNGNNPRP